MWAWISRFSTAWGLLPSNIASAITGTLWVFLMAVIAYIEHTPLFWFMAAAPVTAAALVTLALRLSEWRDRFTASDKLQFLGIDLGGEYNKDSDGKVISLRVAEVGIRLQNTAQFPISILVDELQTSLENNFPPNKPRADKGGVAVKGETKVTIDHEIDMKNDPIKLKIRGTARFKVRYGHPGIVSRALPELH